MKRLPLIASVSVALALSACGVDTTGISPDVTHGPKGNANASVVVAEYADLQCPACRAAHLTLNGPLLEKYGSKIRFEFHHFPLQNIHRFAMDLAEASECAADQGKFWEFEAMAYDKQQELKKGSIETWAKDLGLDMELFGRCTESNIKRKAILASYDQGRSIGVQGTPTYFVNGRQTEATLEALSAAIDAASTNAAGKL